MLESREPDGRLVDGQLNQKRTFNLRPNVTKMKCPTGLRSILLTMKLGEVCWTKLTPEQLDNTTTRDRFFGITVIDVDSKDGGAFGNSGVPLQTRIVG